MEDEPWNADRVAPQGSPVTAPAAIVQASSPRRRRAEAVPEPLPPLTDLGLEPLVPLSPGALGGDAATVSPVKTAGVTAVVVTAATAAGWMFAGFTGAASGLVLSGAGFNLARAGRWWSSSIDEEREEAVKSGTLALFGLGLGGYLAYLAFKNRKGKKKRS